ncbi:hypothetical protein EVAR_43593_1 [Eumeta japonica]|uniref:Endonuclease/exonuclease/phosphatase domain-containing protein n=1 Tax=Eumeta variegata TaxID=151549 RepID=A0A4C1XCT3_EUMVA|nr:hypothetical protein EVAR_43593_1 [Eumeta japonica]
MNDKVNDVCQSMKDKRLDILCMNENKRKGSGGAFKRGSFETYWSGFDQSQRGYHGVGFILSERLSDCVNVNECMSQSLAPELRVTFLLIRIFLGVYAPDVPKQLKEREDFWTDVRNILVKCDRNESIIILGDFNGWRKRQKHNVLHNCDDRSRSKVVDTRMYHGVNFGTEHFLVKATKSVLVDEPKEVCVVNKRTNVNKQDSEWWNFEVRKVVIDKKKAWLDLLFAKANHRVQRKDILKDKL